MAKPEQVHDERLRGMLQDAHGHMRAGKADVAVRRLVEAFMHLLELKPEIKDATVTPRPGVTMPAIWRWPQLGANLKMDSVRTGKPEIEFVRDRFALSEAITYYEFTLETAIKHEA